MGVIRLAPGLIEHPQDSSSRRNGYGTLVGWGDYSTGGRIRRSLLDDILPTSVWCQETQGARMPSANAMCPTDPEQGERELKWELNGDQSKKLRARSTEYRQATLRERNFHPGPGHEVAHAKGENFLYQASRALQRPGQRSLCQVRRFACCEVLDCTVLYCNPSNDTAARASIPAWTSHSHLQTTSMGLGPVKSEAPGSGRGRKSGYIRIGEVWLQSAERTGNFDGW